ncbi:MAG: protein translocase subunit SecD [Bacilli bacterium]
MKKNKKKFLLNTLICLGLFIVMALTINPILKNIKFGLDLQGGFEILYQVKPIDGKLTQDMVNNTYKTISRRIDVLGVSEPNITIEGNDRIRIQLAGVTDQQSAIKILGKQASLTFRDTFDNLLMTSDVLKSGGAKASTDSKGLPAVSLSIKNKDKFYEVTNKISKQKNNQIVIWLDFDTGETFEKEQYKCGSDESNCLSAATVSQGFSSDVIIQGNFTAKQVNTLVELINSGSLPTKLEEISSKTVGAEFGEDSLNKTYLAGIIGIGLIMILMTIIYKFAGLISCLGIAIYTYVTFLLFYLIGGVLTLPGIAALVIGIGMAIDTCVINFARIKDELKNGSTLKTAIKKGNKNSLLTIIDANITTFLVALILFIFGESAVKGFATMLMLSIFVTFIVMLYITRWLLNLFVDSKFFDNRIKLFIGYDKDSKSIINYEKINFVKWGKKYFYCILIFIVLGLTSLCIYGFNLGLDFKGGSSINIKSNIEITEENIKTDLNELKYNLVEIDKIDSKNYIAKISNILTAEEVIKTESYFKDKYIANTEIGVISNIVKKDLIFNAFKSLIFATIGIIIYVSVRFKFSYAISGIVALLHDVFIIIAIFSMLKLEISSIFVAAILSIVGYSINDTIVIFDRIRENLNNITNRKITEKDLENVVNIGLKQTFNRSIITTLTTLFPVITLIIFGSKEIFNFNVALLIGLIAGSASSILVASQLWLVINKKNLGKPKKGKWYETDEIEEKKVKGVNV